MIERKGIRLKGAPLYLDMQATMTTHSTPTHIFPCSLLCMRLQ